MTIAIIDYGLGNLGSVANMLKKIGVRVRVTAEPDEIRHAKALILPGVGHFDSGMRNLVTSGLKSLLDERVLKESVPVLGICLGMQLMARRSDEGTEPGLGWLAADVRRFAFQPRLRLAVPHMGWNEVEPVAASPLYRGLDDAPRFYFVHSYHLVCDDQADVAGWATYGYRFAASVRHGSIFGTQFHPEKSHRFGKAVLRNFAEAVGAA